MGKKPTDSSFVAYLDESGDDIALGEDSTRQFKADVRNAESLASEMAALANSAGGTIFWGVAKGLLPYHGLGSGIKRALSDWSQIDFTDDRDGCLFTATVYRKPVSQLTLTDNGALKVQITGQPDLVNDLLNTLRADPSTDYPSLAKTLGVSEATVKRHIQKLKQQNRLRRVGSRKTGHWEVLEAVERQR